jgi:hypothetical protein
VGPDNLGCDTSSQVVSSEDTVTGMSDGGIYFEIEADEEEEAEENNGGS